MAIQIKNDVKELAPATRKLYDRAQQAIQQKNLLYAIQILHMVLQADPGFVEGHRALYHVEFERVGGKPNFFRALTASITTMWAVQFKGPALLKQGKAVEALNLAEKALDADPTLTSTLQFLSKAAQACELYEIAIDALEVATKANPKNVPLFTALTELYQENKQFQKAITTYYNVRRLLPNSGEVESKLKQLTALASMQEGNWEDKKSDYRTKLKDRAESELLEQQERLGVRDVEAMHSLIRAAEQAVAHQETNANLLKLGELYRKDGQVDKALATYQRIVELSGTMDPVIDEAITELQCANLDKTIDEWKAYTVQNPNKQAEADVQIQATLRQKDDMLFKRQLERVERYPNDSTFRFELAQMYWKQDAWDAAMREFQFAQRSPQHRVKALAFMGRCMVKKGMADLAVEQFNLALEGMDKTDLERKDVLYHLAETYEILQQPDKALINLRELYSLDVNYRDVGEKLQKHYGKK